MCFCSCCSKLVTLPQMRISSESHRKEEFNSLQLSKSQWVQPCSGPVVLLSWRGEGAQQGRDAAAWAGALLPAGIPELLFPVAGLDLEHRGKKNVLKEKYLLTSVLDLRVFTVLEN